MLRVYDFVLGSQCLLVYQRKETDKYIKIVMKTENEIIIKIV